MAIKVVKSLGLEQPARAIWRRLQAGTLDQQSPAAIVEDIAYSNRVESEHSHFDEMVNVHDLPGIFHYWSNKYLLPKVLPLGFDHPDAFFANNIWDAISRSKSPEPVVLSIGAGNCDTEARIAKRLVDMGVRSFKIECLELSAPMLHRGRQYAAEIGVADHIEANQTDFNKWIATRSYAAVMANQSLHHVLDLEHLFSQVRDSLEKGGAFVVGDMIGRNGHMRWPEALDIVNEFWRELPREKRYNHLLRRQDDEFVNWDCSSEGFEGIRAQDILPLLLERFSFHSFLGFSNVIDPFVDRGFGHNYDADSVEDRAIIDRIETRDEAEIRSGRIKPTHMFGVMTKERAGPVRCIDHLTPEFCVRIPS